MFVILLLVSAFIVWEALYLLPSLVYTVLTFVYQVSTHFCGQFHSINNYMVNGKSQQ